jgi:methylmalonyl-CoA/ethylmalonyl-CoA epimerase
LDFFLHHVGLLVADIDREVERYTTRFGYQPCTGIIHDAVQTAYVLFLRLPGERSYLELISPDRHESKLTNSMQKGGGLHHMCYGTSAIYDACTTMKARGMFLLQAPTPAVAFSGRKIAWLIGQDGALTELVEAASAGQL